MRVLRYPGIINGYELSRLEFCFFDEDSDIITKIMGFDTEYDNDSIKSIGQRRLWACTIWYD